ncbi:MAG: nucleotidyltransferase family protein, partial [Burkholderiales bacterium]
MRSTDQHSPILLKALSDPASVQSLSLGEWGLLLRQARTAKVLARIAILAADMEMIERFPEKVQESLGAARKIFEYRQRILRWEVGRIQAALRGLESPVLLLKGAAYELAGLPPARGRIASDVDIMVPEAALASVEAALLRHGWEHSHLEPYDQRYFRDWMHELPPLVHRDRDGIV